MQDEISLAIAGQIRENFGHIDIDEHLVDVSTKNFDAYDYYLKGRFQQLKWEKDAFLKAINYYQSAVEKDQEYALAYFGIFQCWR